MAGTLARPGEAMRTLISGTRVAALVLALGLMAASCDGDNAPKLAPTSTATTAADATRESESSAATGTAGI